MKPKLLIFGANGQLGSALKNLFDENNYQVISSTRNDFTAGKDEVEAYLGSFTELTYIINCIAYHNTDQCEDNPAESFRINAEFPNSLAKYSQANNINLFHISTDYVFDGASDSPYREHDKPNPINVYGISKLAGESAVLNYCASSYVLRVSTLFGNNLRENVPVNFIEKIITAAKSVTSPLKIIDDQFMSPTYAKDAADAILHMIEAGADYGCYHVCNSCSTNWYEYARTFLKLSGIDTEILPIKAVDFHSKARRPHYCVLNNEKINRLHPMRSWQEALKEYLHEKGYLVDAYNS